MLKTLKSKDQRGSGNSLGGPGNCALLSRGELNRSHTHSWPK
jgi:hypothetical protein